VKIQGISNTVVVVEPWKCGPSAAVRGGVSGDFITGRLREKLAIQPVSRLPESLD